MAPITLSSSPEEARSAHERAVQLADEDRFDEAMLLYRRAIEIRRRLNQAGDSELAASLHNLALLNHRAGDREAAAALWDEATRAWDGADSGV